MGAQVWTSQNGSQRKLPLHVAVERMHMTIFRSISTPTSLVQMLLKAYPTAARLTGWADVDKERAEAEAKGEPLEFKEDFMRRDLAVNLVLGENNDEYQATKEDPTFGPACLAVQEIIKPFSPPDWDKEPSACIIS